ncbi:sulfite exporter TauE/SafE family protein [Erythrobacter mangrovi]|uniref:Probable membrane transporter protein n=1 Tax=Erythrobacter mangrovi TaxID=2739433 RepID=A0A7D3XUK6_9SPHN|nr:sulfite exporter TauE/SafE family protein [Erythrobacter mangrovi]QKG70796.1 sulfite exporter TauE/SafE family protein [Erythrobacter mangrovi]
MEIAGFALWQVGIALVATLASAYVRGLAGFGLAILLVPVLALALKPVEAVLIASMLGLMIGLTEIRWLINQAERSAWHIGGMVVLTTAPGMALLAITPAPVARLLIALVALSAFVAVLIPPREPEIPGRLNTLLTGAASGVLTGFAGMPGPPVVPYYVGRSIPREVAKASMVLVFTIASTTGIASGLALGMMHWRLLLLALALFPVVLIGNALGHRALGKISDRAWRIFAATVLGAASFAALLKLL